MAPFEALCGYQCRLPIGWFKVDKTQILGLDLAHQVVEKVKLIQSE